MIDEKNDRFLGTNLKGLMMSLLGRWNEEMDRGRQATEFKDIRASDMRVFGQMRGRTVRQSELHRELGFTRQAAQQAIERLAGHGVVRVEFAEGSKRDKVVSVTPKGQELRQLAAQQIREFEAQCEALIGAEGVAQLRHFLVALQDTARQEG